MICEDAELLDQVVKGEISRGAALSWHQLWSWRSQTFAPWTGTTFTKDSFTLIKYISLLGKWSQEIQLSACFHLLRCGYSSHQFHNMKESLHA